MHVNKRPLFRYLSCLAFSVVVLPGVGGLVDEVERILNHNQAPAGVVFEVVTGDPQFLAKSMPKIHDHSKRLHARFPGLPIAVVTHGVEQFALTSAKRNEYAELHHLVQTLTGEADIPVHVCGTHAGWRDLSPEAFPSYIDVAPVGPVQVENYLALGYELVIVSAVDF